MLDKTISKANEIWYKGDFEPNEKDVHFKDGIYDIWINWGLEGGTKIIGFTISKNGKKIASKEDCYSFIEFAKELKLKIEKDVMNESISYANYILEMFL